MREICYIIRRVCRRSKNVDGSGFGSHYCVDYRDAGKCLTCHVLVHSKFVADVEACKVGGLSEDKVEGFGENSFQQDLIPM